VGLNPQKFLIEGHERGSMMDSIRSQVLKLDVIVVVEPMEEVMRRQSEATLMEGEKRDDVAFQGPHDIFITGC
jgi:hypothetical protein